MFRLLSVNKKCFVLSSLSIFLNTKANAVTKLNPLNLGNNFFSLILIADAVSLSCSLGLEEFKISTL